MKYGSITTLQSQIGNQLSRQQRVKTVRSDQKRKCHLQKERTAAYFEAKDKSFYKKGIEMFEKRWNECITLEGDYVNE